ncbi:MAG: hypothetical protein AAF556_08975 [Pseudomonadota bacterium]
MFPIMNNVNHFKYPWSGNINQDISPDFIGQMRGVPEIEWEVITQVGSYGDQLGTIIDALKIIAKHLDLDDACIKKFCDLADEVDKAKDRANQVMETHATEALRRLKKADPVAHARVISEASE